jgi:hypothetical protein
LAWVVALCPALVEPQTGFIASGGAFGAWPQVGHFFRLFCLAFGGHGSLLLDIWHSITGKNICSVMIAQSDKFYQSHMNTSHKSIQNLFCMEDVEDAWRIFFWLFVDK